MTLKIQPVLMGAGALLTFSSVLAQIAAQEMPQITTEQTKSDSGVTAEQLQGIVVKVEGNDLLVRAAGGELRNFIVPESTKFIIDGQERSLQELQPGTKLTAKVVTITIPLIERTTTIGAGKVWYVSGNTVVVTLPNKGNRMFTVEERFQFTVNGQKASVHDLKKGMTVSAQKIVEEPKTLIASDTVVTGQAPSARQPMRQ
jgi:hypothetical protein